MAVTSYKSPKKVSAFVQGGNHNNVGILSPIGALTSAISVGSNNIIAVYNSSTSTQFVRTGDSSVTIGTNYVQNIAVPPTSYIYIHTGGDKYIIGSSGIYGYILMDEASPSHE